MTTGFGRYPVMCVLALLLVAAGRMSAAAVPEPEITRLFSEANSFFNQANDLLETNPAQAQDLYRKTVLRYERLVAEGIENGRLYYNIGNVYYRLGDIGRAILNYRRAEQFVPNDANLRQNLGFVLEQRQDNIEVQQRQRVLKTVFFWHYDLPAGVRAVVFAISYGLFWIVLGVRLFWRKPWLHWCLAVFFTVSLLFSGSLLIDRYRQATNPAGVLIEPEVVARKGDGLSYQPSFEEPLHSGTEFVLLENRGDWRYVELLDGRRTWIPAPSGELVRK
jgi:tetratricopeptide (TPR) repeat protein